jgi:hypothetical protein
VVAGVEPPGKPYFISRLPQVPIERIQHRTIARANEAGNVLKDKPTRSQVDNNAGEFTDERVAWIVRVLTTYHRKPLTAGASEHAVHRSSELGFGVPTRPSLTSRN